EISFILMSSPAQWEKVGSSWDNFLKSPSGTGPWRVDRYVPRERLELVKNDSYWNPARRPKLARVVLGPMPEATSRTAA
ncbi:ABC transporter substrate-binding protein, partial [Streptococcus pneumoniae]|uniref:ABC transporter substrate-binding protein n=1 Tax=Streptococcus pneumoniae TaxID=1313 RepID=UPI001EF8DD74